MEQLVEIITGILQKNGTLGVTTWLLLGWLFKFWNDKWGEPANSTKVLASVIGPFAVVLAAYFGGVLLGVFPMSQQGVVDALVLAGSEVIGSKLWFGASRKIEAHNDPEAMQSDMDAEPGPKKKAKRNKPKGKRIVA